MKAVSLHWILHPDKREGLYFDENGKARSPWYDGEIKSKQMSRSAVARELDICYEMSVEGIVFPEFGDIHILKTDFQPDKNLPVIVAIDYGATSAAVFGQKLMDGRMVFFHEIVLEGNGKPRNQAKAIQSYCADLQCKDYRFYDDPSGANTGWVDDTTCVQIMNEYDIFPTHRVQGTSNRRKQDRVDMISFKLTELGEEGKPSLQFCQTMKTTIDAFRSGYRYLEDRNGKINVDTIDEIHPYEDVMDCVGMALCETFTVAGKMNLPKPKKAVRDPYTNRRIR